MEWVWTILIIALAIGIRIWRASRYAEIAAANGRDPNTAALMGCLFGWWAGLYYRNLDQGGAGPGTGWSRLGPRAQAQQNFESSLPPGGCRICRYVNAAGSARCYQCGNIL